MMAPSLKLAMVPLIIVVCFTLVCRGQLNTDNNSNNDNNDVIIRRRGPPLPVANGNGTTTSRRRGGNNRRGNRGNRRRGGSRRPHSSCEEIYLPMCKGLIKYTHTKLPNSFGHTTQQQVYQVLEHKWSHMDHSCSKNMRLMLCAQYLPKCHGRRQGLPPCRRTCMAARRKCRAPLREFLNVVWGTTYPCRSFPQRRCVRPAREKRCQHRHPTCVSNSAMPICSNLTFTYGTLPNMFEQCDTDEINAEVQYYDELIATNCHDSLKFLLCGVYSPFCIRAERPFTFPCRELCDEVRSSCESHYRRLYHNLPWPNKLQCHRYPSTTTEGSSCVMPNEGTGIVGTQ